MAGKDQDENPLVNLSSHREQFEFLLHKFVMNEEMTPAEADELAIGQNIDLRGEHVEDVRMDDARWYLVYAVLWISWRDEAQLINQWERYKCWSGHIWRDLQSEQQTESLESAQQALWKALREGKVNAIGLSHHDTDYSDIPAIHWYNLEWPPNYKRWSVRNFAQVENRYRLVMVDSRDVLAIWPKQGAEPEISPVKQATTSSSHRLVGGPKVTATVEALEEMFERKPRSKNRVHLLAKLKEKMGHEVSGSTLDRAWNEAWK